MILALVAGMTALAGVTALFADRYGFWGVAGVMAVLVIGLAVTVLLPEGAWGRLVGADSTADDLGVLHEEGVILRHGLPWLDDVQGEEELKAYQGTVEDWATRVHDRLPPRWRGVFLSNPPGTHFSTGGYAMASRIRNWLDDRLERLSQIMTTIGRGE